MPPREIKKVNRRHEMIGHVTQTIKEEVSGLLVSYLMQFLIHLSITFGEKLYQEVY